MALLWGGHLVGDGGPGALTREEQAGAVSERVGPHLRAGGVRTCAEQRAPFEAPVEGGRVPELSSNPLLPQLSRWGPHPGALGGGWGAVISQAPFWARGHQPAFPLPFKGLPGVTPGALLTSCPAWDHMGRSALPRCQARAVVRRGQTARRLIVPLGLPTPAQEQGASGVSGLRTCAHQVAAGIHPVLTVCTCPSLLQGQARNPLLPADGTPLRDPGSGHSPRAPGTGAMEGHCCRPPPAVQDPASAEPN